MYDVCLKNYHASKDSHLTPLFSIYFMQLPSQKGTLNCLQRVIDHLSETCKHEVLHLSVFQGDNIRLDHKLSAACADDHKRFCPDVQPGSGKVYKCLMQYRMDRTMSQAVSDIIASHMIVLL